ncbi:MAG: GYD domain-containing protein [Longimicrobiales bacterium]
MPTYILLSKLTDDGAETLRDKPGRIREVNDEIGKLGVKVVQQYAVLGPYDFVNIVEAPDNGTIARVSVELGARGSVQITTLAAIPLDEFVASLKRRTV